ncbi:MAG: GPW/gp25 family protein [Oscillospiraceae bacterium]|nr:GPW/gp25 family protein [Oscillospiraceae bacterium]
MIYSVNFVKPSDGMNPSVGSCFTFSPATVEEEILQNVSMILSTVRGTVPLDRNFGVSDRFVDRPVPAVNALMRAELFDAIEKNEPRAEVVDILIDYDKSGKLTTKVEVEI